MCIWRAAQPPSRARAPHAACGARRAARSAGALRSAIIINSNHYCLDQSYVLVTSSPTARAAMLTKLLLEFKVRPSPHTVGPKRAAAAAAAASPDTVTAG